MILINADLQIKVAVLSFNFDVFLALISEMKLQ